MCKIKIYYSNINSDCNACLNKLKNDWNPTYLALNCVGNVYYWFSVPNPNDSLNHDAIN